MNYFANDCQSSLDPDAHKPGLFEMPEAEYRALPALNQSAVKRGFTSMTSVRHALTQSDGESTSAMRMGSLANDMILRPDEIQTKYHILVNENGVTKACKEEKAEAESQGKTPIKQKDYDNAYAIARSILGHDRAAHTIRYSRRELVAVWWDAEFGVWKKAMIDCLFPGERIADIKTSNDPSYWAFRGQARRLHYLFQAAWYQEGVEALTGKTLPWEWLVVGSSAPHDVAIYKASAAHLATARKSVRYITEQVVSCLKTDLWSGLDFDGAELDLPDYCDELAGGLA